MTCNVEFCEQDHYVLLDYIQKLSGYFVTNETPNNYLSLFTGSINDNFKGICFIFDIFVGNFITCQFFLAR